MVCEKMLALGQSGSIIRDLHEFANRRVAQIGEENVYDFTLGNPSVPTPPAVTAALQKLVAETPPETLHAYTAAPGDPTARKAIADFICNTYHVPASAGNIYITAGAAASLAISFHALTRPGDEILTLVPYFPEYRVYAEKAGAIFKEVPCQAGTFQLDAEALEAAITPNTKALIVNSPNNPTGVVLNEQSVHTLAEILRSKSAEYGHPIYLIADEPYRELVYGNAVVPYLPAYYPHTIVCYSFSKSLSLPGERIGYIFVSPQAAEAKTVYDAVCGAGRALGYICAPTLFQQLLSTCLGCSCDMSVYNENRTLLYNALTEYGFQAVYPDGAFYLFLKSPEPDANAFCRKATEFELFLVPGDDFGCPGYVRIAYCVSTQQIKNSLPAFQKLAKLYLGA